VQSKTDIAIDRAVGARIKNLRLRNKLSQTALGEQIGVTFQQIQKYENGTNRISAGRLVQLAKFFGVPVAAFYSEVQPGNAKFTKGLSATGADKNLDRLVTAFQALKKKNIRAAILRVAEEMAGRQRRDRRGK
jgi:transcriptional regulator with XRE-family HTH domain